MQTSQLLSELTEAIADLNEQTVLTCLDHCLARSVPAREIIGTMSAGMEKVGRRYKEGVFFLSELVFAGEIFRNAMERLRPLIGDAKALRQKEKVLVGTVKDDIHDLGKNIVIMMLESAGYEVIDLGVDVPPERFLAAIRDSGARLVGLSVLLTTAFASLKSTVDRITSAGLRDRVKIMIGGSCTSERTRDQVGADYYGSSAVAAVDIAEEVFSSKRV